MRKANGDLDLVRSMDDACLSARTRLKEMLATAPSAEFADDCRESLDGLAHLEILAGEHWKRPASPAKTASLRKLMDAAKDINRKLSA